ncbi:MAG: CapA family protein [Bacteroidia bacterium]|jgi:poly-gamma-glutamate synthesis protein (capsule biosynthesis protein)|nr:CapA family protein [Bacteroidia bacterium]
MAAFFPDRGNLVQYLCISQIVLVVGGILLADERGLNAGVSPAQVQVVTQSQDSVVTFTLNLTGDLMCHSPQTKNALQPGGDYDFTGSFAEIQQALSSADFTIGNLETTTAGPGRPYMGYPAFNSPDAYLAALKLAGFDFLVTANNHSMDTGEDGLLRTLEQVRKNGLGSTGTHHSAADRDSVRIAEIKGTRMAILNYTYGTNGTYPSAAHKWMLNVEDSTLVKTDIARARQKGAELVLVFFHWGIENRGEPTAKQDSMFRYTVAAGADLIIGAHPHVVGPMQKFKTQHGATLDTGIVAWSLGNFLSNQYWRYTDAGVILTLTLEKNFTTGKIALKSAEIVPTWVYRAYHPALKNHVIIPGIWCSRDSLPAWIDTESKRRLCEADADTRKMMLPVR